VKTRGEGYLHKILYIFKIILFGAFNMKKWELACFIVVVLAFVLILAIQQVQFRDRDSLISNLQSENSDLQTQTDALQTQVDTLETKVTALQTDKTNLMSQVSSLQNQKVALQTQVSNLDFQVSGLEVEISRLEEQIRSQILGVFFSPNGGCEDQVLYWIGRANVSINILIYSFSLDSVGDSLIAAHNRGVEVQVVFEESQIITGSEYQKLKAADISVRNDTNSKDMHDKVMVVDGYIVITGSFNWSEKASISLRSGFLSAINISTCKNGPGFSCFFWQAIP
jgi:phosphatidylserine/phosphatidylglycerophosphate/cardiolipin synthase-like enzyme